MLEMGAELDWGKTLAWGMVKTCLPWNMKMALRDRGLINLSQIADPVITNIWRQ